VPHSRADRHHQTGLHSHSSEDVLFKALVAEISENKAAEVLVQVSKKKQSEGYNQFSKIYFYNGFIGH